MGRRQFRARFGVHADDHRIEHLADAPFGALLDACNQQTVLRLRGLNVVARAGDLPVPQLDKPIPDGAQYLVHLDFNGEPLNRVMTWRETLAQISPDQEVLDGTARLSPANAALQTGEWIPTNFRDWVRALRTDPNPTSGAEVGDMRLTLEPDHEELFAFDGTAWQNLYSADRVKAWIAALNLFEGTTNEDGTAIPGAVQFAALPDLPTNADPDLSAHYFTFVGTPGYVIKPTDPRGVGADLVGVILNPGDWLQVVNKGTPTAPDLHWVHIGGDLLAKSRGDRLYGLQAWRDGSWETGSLVVDHGDIYRALRGVVAGDPEPGAAVTPPATQPWELVPISGGLKIAQVDHGGGTGALPDSAPAGEVWIVLQSAIAGGQQALFAYDGAAKRWQQLGGGGVPLDLTGGEIIYPKNLIDMAGPPDQPPDASTVRPSFPGDLLLRRHRGDGAGHRPTIAAVSPDGKAWWYRQDDVIVTDPAFVIPTTKACFPGQKIVLVADGRAEIIAVADANAAWVPTQPRSDVLLWNRSNMPDGFANWSGGDMALKRAAKPGHLLRLDIAFTHSGDMNYGTQKVSYALRDAAGADVVADWWQCADSIDDEGSVSANVAGGFWLFMQMPADKKPATKLNLATQRIHHNGTSTTCRIQFALTDMGLY
jgi:hypothetical protein